MSKAVKFVKHDDMMLYYTREAIDAGLYEIGFYFDRVGYPQSINRRSLYGNHVLAAEGLL